MPAKLKLSSIASMSYIMHENMYDVAIWLVWIVFRGLIRRLNTSKAHQNINFDVRTTEFDYDFGA